MAQRKVWIRSASCFEINHYLGSFLARQETEGIQIAKVSVIPATPSVTLSGTGETRSVPYITVVIWYEEGDDECTPITSAKEL